MTKAVSNWRDIAREAWCEPLVWERLEATRPRRNYDDLCEVFVCSMGLPLAKKWFHSKVDDQRRAVWRPNALSNWCLANVHLWSEFDAGMKDVVLAETFSRS